MSKNNQKPIFIIGCERSGTTLIRLILHSHPNIALPPQTKFLKKIYKRRLQWRNLANEANRIKTELKSLYNVRAVRGQVVGRRPDIDARHDHRGTGHGRGRIGPSDRICLAAAQYARLVVPWHRQWRRQRRPAQGHSETAGLAPNLPLGRFQCRHRRHRAGLHDRPSRRTGVSLFPVLT
ncbi:MAG TPA: hypothetical protein EYQ40_01340, partial [Candidatus Marinimicrobia bacterium]|nr:hypothetical protein [Candidatus Neomarinimicrobiota bacterium]